MASIDASVRRRPRAPRARPVGLSLLAGVLLALSAIGAASASASIPAGIAWNGLLGSDSAPAYVTLPGNVEVERASLGNNFNLAIGDNGKLYAWGDNSKGELGDGTTTDQTTPEEVSLPGGVEPVQVATGGGSYEFSLVLGANGELYTAGDDSEGQLGIGQDSGTSDTFVEVELPEGVTATSIAAGVAYALAAGSNGKVYAWGYNPYGELGDGTTTSEDTPEAISLPNGATATAVAAGYSNSFALASDGTLYGWGAAGTLLGDNTPPGDYGEVFGPAAVTMPAGVTVAAVTEYQAGNDVAFAIGSDGHLYGWGDNYDGELGDGTGNPEYAPVPISLPGGAEASAVAAGPGDNYVIDTSGQVYSDGIDEGYDLGDATAGTGDVKETFEPIDQPSGFSATAVYPGGYDNDENPGEYAVAVGSTSHEAPRFTVDSPPGSLAGGSGVDYTFTAVGEPAPTYALAPGAPAWLLINPTTGELTGTAPAGYELASYSVLAESTAGTTTAGPFYLADPSSTATVSGSVYDGQSATSNPTGAVVDACASGSSFCIQAPVQGDGSFSLSAIVGTTLTLTAYPPQGGDFGGPSAAVPDQTVPAGGLSDVDLVLPAAESVSLGLGSQPAGTTAPTLVWTEGTQVTESGCSDGFGAVSVQGQVGGTGQWQTNIYPLTESPPGSGDYIGTVPPQYPTHGSVSIESRISCPPLSNLAPSLGPAGGGTTVQVTGSGFTGATQVDFGSTPASSFQVISDEDVQAVAPPGSGTVPVTVTTPSGPLTSDDYTYQAVTGVSPASGVPAGGNTVTITGTGLGSVDAVDFGGVRAAFTPVSGTEVTATAPAQAAGTVDVTVGTVYGGTTPTSAADRYTYTTTPGGGVVARRAAGHARPTATATAAASPRLTLLGALARRVTELVTENAGELVAGFENSEAASQAIEQFLTGVDPCKLGQLALAQALKAALEVPTEAYLDAVVPELVATVVAATAETGPGALAAGAITAVAAHFATGYLLDYFSDIIADQVLANLGCEQATPGVMPPIVINALIDPSGNVLDTNGNPIGGATVTILRSDVFAGPFTPVDVTQPGIEPATNPETTDTAGTFMWDVDSGFYEVQAGSGSCTDPNDPSSSTATIGPYPVPPPQTGLTITLSCPDESPAPTPTVTGLGVTSGPPAGGTSVQVSGTGFTPTSTASFGGTAATSTQYLSPTALLAVSPAGSGSADVVVQGPGGSSATSAADEFFYGNAPQVTGLSVTQGSTAGGTSVTISGSGFTGATGVGFGSQPASAFTVTSDGAIQATAPAGMAGTVDVTVETPAGGSTPVSADQFTYVTPSSGGGINTNTNTNTTTTTTPTSPGTPGLTAIFPPSAPRAPVLSAVSLVARTFTAHAGTMLRLTLSEAAGVSVVVEHSKSGRRRRGGPCRANAKKGTRCTLVVRVATLSLTGAKGADRLKFAPGDLPAGSYTARVVAQTTAGSSAPATVHFTIEKPKKAKKAKKAKKRH
jgi:hypothetical protein